ncbi:hypothetical protein [Brazilian marseillevirus]|uniref:hypothetical protein n=1 Tax=Brazilian marseillevirus TaxID=1813599 RepID=UPI00078288AD|nr:hypothetical protein A3303_gp225 [Brazilian marseillevirus]AMQ10733.1 hypothetical protein [Brazilian marseillevirus]
MMKKFLGAQEFVSLSVSFPEELEVRETEKSRVRQPAKLSFWEKKEVSITTSTKISYLKGTKVKQGPLEMKTTTETTIKLWDKPEMKNVRVLVTTGHCFSGKFHGEIHHKLYLKNQKTGELSFVQDIVATHKDGTEYGSVVKIDKHGKISQIERKDRKKIPFRDGESDRKRQIPSELPGREDEKL